MNAIRSINNALQKIPSDYAMVAVAVMTLLEVFLLSSNPTSRVAKQKHSVSAASQPNGLFTAKASNSWSAAGAASKISASTAPPSAQSPGNSLPLLLPSRPLFKPNSPTHRADTCCAILLRTKPSLQPILTPDEGESAIPGFTIGNIDTRLLSLTASHVLTQRIIYIYLRLRYLTQFLTLIPTKNTSQIDDCFYSDKIDFIERAI
jgi:hypothetical protein